MSTNGLLLTKSNVHELTSAQILSFSSNEYWHKFILENGGLYDESLVLDAVLDLVHPFDLVPVKYTSMGQNSFFLARNCGQAIEKLCLNLIPSFKLKGFVAEVSISIQTCFMLVDEYKINMQVHLKKVIEKRLKKSKKNVIDLSCFYKEPELYKLFYCPLSRPKFLLYVLCILKKMVPATSIILSKNNIKDVNSLEILKHCTKLTALDLSQNKIEDIRLIEVLGQTIPNLQEIHLNRNPICKKFKTELGYVKWVKMNLPKIKNIDGFKLYYGIPNLKTFLCKENFCGIVNSFLQHYFTLYDNDRQALEQTYDKDALFSITCSSCFSDTTQDSNLLIYQSQSRMLLRENNKNKIQGVCQNENERIIKVLLQLPFTEHDPYSFKVDVLLIQEPSIVLRVSGVFRDFEEETRVRSFNRTFVLKKVASDEYKITNDLFHLTIATEEEINNSFKYGKPPQEKNKIYLNKEEEQKIIATLSTLTDMNSAYSKKCLEDCEWDLKQALEVFIKNCQNFSIPAEAFVK